MARYERFTFLCDPSERRAIAYLAARLQRSQSDAVRFVVIEAARQLSLADSEIVALPARNPPKRRKRKTTKHSKPLPIQWHVILSMIRLLVALLIVFTHPEIKPAWQFLCIAVLAVDPQSECH